MDLSGSNYKSFARHRLVAEWTATQDIANNQSTVTVKVFLQSVDAVGAMSAPASNAGSVKVDSTTKNFTATSQLSAYQKKQLTSQSFVVSHNADGTASFNYSVTYNINVTFAGVFYGNQTVSGSGTLNTIPRASSIASIVGNQIGGNVTVTITRASNSFKHIVMYTNTDGNVVTVGENVDTSKTFTISMNDCSHLPNSTSGTAKITVDTYSGDSRIGSHTLNHTVYVPESVVPVISSMTTSEKTQSIVSLNLGTGVFVQGKSNIEVTVLGDGVYGSKITSAWVGIDKVGSVNSHTGTFSLSYADKIFGSTQFSVSIIDSRGRSAGANGWINIMSFEKPFIKNFSAKRIGNGTIVEITKDAFADRVETKTDYTISIARRVVGGSWETINTEISSNTNILNFSGFLIDKSYELRLTVGDYFQDTSSVITISTVKTLLDLNKDIGIGIGKLNEGEAILEIEGSVKVTNGTVTGGVGYVPGTMPLGDMYNPSYWVNNFPLGISLRFLSTEEVGNRPTNYLLLLIMKFSWGDYRVLGFAQPSDNERFYMLTGNSVAVSKWSQINTVPV